MTTTTATRKTHTQDPWVAGQGAKTPAQAFFEAYAANVDAGEYMNVPLTKWYSPTCEYHGQDGVIYRGAEAMGEWMRGPVFGMFEKVQHQLGQYVEIAGEKEGDEVWVFMRSTRQLFLKGNTSETPDVSVPMLWSCTIGPAETADGYGGLQFKVVHLGWDTASVVTAMRARNQSYQGHA